MTNMRDWDENLQVAMAEVRPVMTEASRAMVAHQVRPATRAAQAIVDSVLGPAREAAAVVARQAIAQGLSTPMLPILDDLQVSIRLQVPSMSVLGLDLSRDLLQVLADAETISRQLDTDALANDDSQDSDEDGPHRVARLRDRISSTLAELVTLEARLRERATELNDGLDAYRGLIDKAAKMLVIAYVLLDKLIT